MSKSNSVPTAAEEAKSLFEETLPTLPTTIKNGVERPVFQFEELKEDGSVWVHSGADGVPPRKIGSIGEPIEEIIPDKMISSLILEDGGAGGLPSEPQKYRTSVARQLRRELAEKLLAMCEE